ncbi:hypothetical protein CRI94_13115 [Longibacter salinarum]|uniref:Uncharacterized protein n=1 Tax=Longibacter salinarum TaxID=1850348 RepID=A0A2A8CWG4_9BACT|nr:hypothetical protein [Longibacter salinarum]PEN12937.1 hypothetical protein CRI94_13115 [Longibacter salinarum]
MRTCSLHTLVICLCVVSLVGCDSGGSPTGTDPGTPGGGDGGGGSTPAFSSREAPGDSARSFLDDTNFTVLALEVDYMTGYRPEDTALADLRSELVQHLDKASITVESLTEIPAAGQDTYSTNDIVDLEDQYRDAYTETRSDTLWAYVLFVDGKFTTQNVVGIAYYNTSQAFFGQTIEEISGGVTQPSKANVEATVLRHEFGHNLGLVNNGTSMQQDHQDDPNGAHCTNDQCVMYYSIETTNFFGNAFDGSVPGFEQFCTEDMDAIASQ